MNSDIDPFDIGFDQTREWITRGKIGAKPLPNIELNQHQRIDWWHGHSKAFDFCAEVEKIEDVQAALTEDFIHLIINIALVGVSAYLITRWYLPISLIGVATLIVSLKRIFK